MNGFTSFVATFCLIAVGLLIGWVASASFGSNSWNALSAIGSWIGGLGALSAAAVALYISHRQEQRDTYKLYIEVCEVKHAGVSFTKIDDSGNQVPDRGPGHLMIQAHNSGLRPIELIRLVYEHEHGSGSLPITECFVEAGKRAVWECKENVTFLCGSSVIPVYSNKLLDGRLKVVDAAGVVHEVNIIQ